MPELTREPKGHTSKSEDNFDYIRTNSTGRPYLCLPRQKSFSARHASHQKQGFTGSIIHRTLFPSTVSYTILKVERGWSKGTQLSTQTS